MNEAEMLLAIRGQAWDSEPRTVYLDWLEERDPARAEVFRRDLELARCIDEPASIVPWRRLREVWTPCDWADAALTHHKIIMVDAGPAKIHTVKEVRELLGVGLLQAKRIVDACALVVDGLDGVAAFAVAVRLRSVRARVRIEPSSWCEAPDRFGTTDYHATCLEDHLASRLGDVTSWEE